MILKKNPSLHHLIANTDALSSRRPSFETVSVRTSLPRLEELPRASLGSRLSLLELAFEGALKESRVYRRAKRNSLDGSIRSSVARTHAWSVFSGISLSEISNLSVLALPIYPHDIANPQHYAFRQLQPHPGDGLVAPGPPFQSSIFRNCLEMQLQFCQLLFYPYADHISFQCSLGHSDSDPFQILINLLRCGTPLVALLGHISDPTQSQHASLILPDLNAKTSRWDGWQDVGDGLRSEFTAIPGMEVVTEHWFNVDDLMDDSTENQIKVSLP